MVIAAMLAERLGVPQATLAGKVEVDGTTPRAQRVTAAGRADVEAELPAVVSVLEKINEPRYPSFKGIMAAKNKPTSTLSIADLGIDPSLVGLAAAATVVVDSTVRPPRGERTVVTDDATRWPVTTDQLFAVGREGVRADGPLECDVIDDTGIRVLEGATFYAATHLVWLESYLDPGPYGALAIAPTRSTIAACPIRKDTAEITAERLRAFAGDAHEDGPGSLSPDLFWWREGRMSLLERANTGPAALPDEFLRFVASLP